jgi:transporter family protein
MKTLLESWPLWALLSAVFAAMTAVLAKVGVQDVNAGYATFIRTVVVILFLAAILAVTGEFRPLSSVSRRSQVFLVLSGLATGVSWLCYFRALQLGPVSRVAPIDKLSLLLVAVFGVFLLGEKLSGRNWLGLALMAAGAVLVALKR